MKILVCLIFAIVAFVVCSSYANATAPKLNRQARIFNGRETSIAEQSNFKHQVKIITARQAGNFECGGSIVNAKVVITAAHCVVYARYVDVYFGVRNQIEIYNDDIQSQKVKTTGLRIHKDYDADTHQNDIAIVILPRPIQFSSTVGPIKLAAATDICSGYKSKVVTVSGWGKTNNNGNYPAILRTVDVKITDSNDCRITYPKFFKDDTMICASGAQKSGACVGDSGGPMVLNIDNVPTLIGITSFAATGCEHSYHRVFTCISGHSEWIEQNMRLF